MFASAQISSEFSQWAPREQLTQESMAVKYAYSVYWAVTMTTGIGGQNNPEETIEIW